MFFIKVFDMGYDCWCFVKCYDWLIFCVNCKVGMIDFCKLVKLMVGVNF